MTPESPSQALLKARELAAMYPTKESTELGKAMFNAQVALDLPEILSELERLHAENAKVTKERDEHEKKRKESHALFLKAHTEECRLATENKALLDFVENQPCLCGIDFDCKRCTLLNSFHKTL